MQKVTESAEGVEVRIERFLAKKAVQYPKLGLAIMDPKTAESSLKPVHQVLDEKLIDKNGKSFLNYAIALVKSYPVTTYSRTH